MVSIAFVALIPDAGHIFPLLRIAKALSKYGASIRFYVPEEAGRLIQETEFNFDLLRPVLPKNADHLLKIISNTTPLSRKLFYNRYFHINYYNPLQYRGLASLPDLHRKLNDAPPDIIVADEHFFGLAVQHVGYGLGIPVILHRASGSNQKCQIVQPYKKSQSPLTVHAIGLLSTIIWKLFSVFSFCLQNENFHSKRKVNKRINQEWEKIVQTQQRSGVRTKVFTTGAAALECKYLCQAITVCTDMTVFGPLPPLVSKEIPSAVQRWLELEPEKPIIYLSLGTMVTISEKLAYCLTKAVKKLRCRVLWVSKLNSIPKNYQTDPDMYWSAWVPQPVLLANPRVKCFVSHAGSGAVQEALWFAKPMLCIPQIWDQSYNAWVIQELGVGRVIDKRNFSEAEITQYLVELLGDSGMQKKSKQYSQEVRTLNTSKAVSDYILSELGLTKSTFDAGI